MLLSLVWRSLWWKSESVLYHSKTASKHDKVNDNGYDHEPMIVVSRATMNIMSRRDIVRMMNLMPVGYSVSLEWGVMAASLTSGADLDSDWDSGGIGVGVLTPDPTFLTSGVCERSSASWISSAILVTTVGVFGFENQPLRKWSGAEQHGSGTHGSNSGKSNPIAYKCGRG